MCRVSMRHVSKKGERMLVIHIPMTSGWREAIFSNA